MKKKVKKISKYSLGTIGAKNTDLSIKSNPAGEAYHAQMRRKFLGSGGAGSGISMPGGIATASNEILTNALGIEDNSQAGVTLNSAAQGADIGGSIVPGWGHLIGGVAGGLIGSFKKGSVDEFGNITYGGIFGRSKSSLQREANVKKNSIAAVTHTLNLQADYYNNPNVILQPTTAAEGGIMRLPVDALVSKGELIYNPMTKKLSKVPGSKGKPNKADDVYARLYEGDVVISNSPTMLMANGKTPALNLERLVDRKPREQEIHTDGFRARTPRMYKSDTLGAREMMIKKVVNWQEANKTKPQEYAKFSEGIYYVDGQRAIYRNGRWWWNEGGKKDAQGKMYFVPYTGKATPSETEPIKYTSETPVGILDPAYRQHVRYSSTDDVERKTTVSKPSSGKKTTTSRVTTSTASQEEKLTPEQIAESLRILDIGERHWLRGSVTEPKQSFTSLAKITPEKIKSQGINNVTPLTGIKPLTDTTGTDSIGYTGSNWKDNLYRMAVLSQPLWDRAEAEPVNYESPVYKYMPTQIDVSSQLRDADQSYALARYNFANLYPNTGAGMAAGLQAASNRAKQYADIRQWQTNALNELIGKNVGIYNNWSNEHARIMNEVYNKTAANRAAARNINRQNRSAALRNYGQMLSDDNKMAMERMKFNILKPAIKSTYEDATANDLINMYNSLFV